MGFSVFVLVLSFFTGTFGECIWYGVCNEKESRFQNCPVNPPAGPFPFQNKTKSLSILKRKCPHLLKQYPEGKFCCDDEQVEILEKNMDYASGLFERCPTCIFNLNQHICAMVCSPEQSNFVNPVEILTNDEGINLYFCLLRRGEFVTTKKPLKMFMTEKMNETSGKEDYIMKIDFYVTDKYKETTFDSCKEVTTPFSGGKAIEMSCGVWGAADQCTAERWFEFFGDFKNNLVAPFDINYSPDLNDSFKNLDIKTLPCNESYGSLKACSCSDCEASCTIPFEHAVASEPFTVANIDGVLFVMIILYVVLSITTMALLIRYHYIKKSESFVEESLKNDSNFLKELGKKTKVKLTELFTKWGGVCARYPVLIFAVSSWIIAILGYGALYLKITTDPTEIWASPTCKTRLDKYYFDTRFTPFYRTNQVFIKAKGLKAFNWTSPDNFTYHFGPAFNTKFLKEVYHLQMDIQKLSIEEGKGLNTICFSPMKNEFFNEDSVDYCAIQSVWGYLQNDISLINDTNSLYDKLQKCVRNNFDPNCLAPFGGPVFSSLAIGDYLEESGSDSQNKPLLANGVSLTFMVNNAVNKIDLEPALAWEKMFVDFLKDWNLNKRPEFMEIAFAAERSIEDEIERESKAEMTTIIISYTVMFLYITISLGRIRGCSTLFFNSKFTLGAGGIIIVLASVGASLGVFGYIGVATTLLTIEVIPFLVLAVGVDNIFILVHTYQEVRMKREKSIEEDVAKALGKVGPSILLTSTSEAACFAIGALSDMPAIKTFAQYSSLAIVLNFCLQISCFVSLLTLDSRRQENNYTDVFCCIRSKRMQKPQEKTSNFSSLVFKNYYGPFLMKPLVRISVIMVFIFGLCASLICLTHTEKGLDQELAMPDGSYVIDYFKFMKDLLSVGPPVYFIIKNGINYTNPLEVNAVCGSVGCDSDSLVTYLTRASRLANISYIAKSPSSWIDDYFDWLSISQKCCKQFKENGSFCPHQFSDCETCEVTVEDWRPQPVDFRKYLPYFLNDNPDMICPKAGHPAYGGGVNFEFNDKGELEVMDNYFMAYHTPLKTSRDFYNALENSRKIANHLSKVLSSKLNRTIEVISYSIFYVYYEQYLTIVKDALVSLSLSLVAVFVVTFLFMGFDLKSSSLVCVVVTSMLVNMAGMLFWWDITLNAVSLVNLLVAVGIGVEFCSHVVHAFVSSSEKESTSKALYAISTMGSSVFSGITLTKFLGIIVLAFAQTIMLRIFYFKMYLGIVVMGAIHGLVLMPVLLTYFG